MLYIDRMGGEHKPSSSDVISWRVSGYALLVKDKKVLMLNATDRKDHEYCLPGGGIEATESLIEGIKRECLEELGYEVELEDEPFAVSTSKFFLFGKFYQSLNIIFKGAVKKQNTSIRKDEPVPEIPEWKSLNELNKGNVFPYQYHVIQKLKKQL